MSNRPELCFTERKPGWPINIQKVLTLTDH